MFYDKTTKLISFVSILGMVSISSDVFASLTTSTSSSSNSVE